jgi:hypothetical protein
MPVSNLAAGLDLFSATTARVLLRLCCELGNNIISLGNIFPEYFSTLP